MEGEGRSWQKEEDRPEPTAATKRKVWQTNIKTRGGRRNLPLMETSKKNKNDEKRKGTMQMTGNGGKVIEKGVLTEGAKNKRTASENG